jgi:IMP dehydrogenase
MEESNKNFDNTPLLALTFDDISIYPIDKSDIPSRRHDSVSLFSQISPNITLKLPIIASYMDTVCESKMAIECARNGGMGVIHRHLTIDRQVKEVGLVKRAESLIIPNPYTVSLTATLQEVKKESKEKGIGGFLVVDAENRLLGIISEHDIDLQRMLRDDNLTVAQAMMPYERVISASPDITKKEAIELMLRYRLKKIPLVDEHQKLRGLISKKSILRLENKLATRDQKGRLVVAAAVGLGADMMDRIAALVDAEVDMIVLAIANGYLTKAADAVKAIKMNFPKVDLAAGVVAENKGAERLFSAGADTVLVGIGSGSICETRQVAGVGIPQFTALRMAQKAARKHGKFIISDGGISKPHHWVKALFAGASATILGKVFAGTDESPPEVKRIGGALVKYHRGLASDNAKRKFDEIQGKLIDVDPEARWDYVYKYVHAEGVESGFVNYTGSAQEAIREITGGLRSCMTYLGARNIEELWEACNRGQYVRVTSAGNREGSPHDLLSFTT